jgi:hypothetical protein
MSCQHMEGKHGPMGPGQVSRYDSVESYVMKPCIASLPLTCQRWTGSLLLPLPKRKGIHRATKRVVAVAVGHQWTRVARDGGPVFEDPPRTIARLGQVYLE